MARTNLDKTSIVDRLFGNNERFAQQAEKTLTERREGLAEEIKRVDAKSKKDIRAYVNVAPDVANRTPDLTHDDREVIIKKASRVLTDRLVGCVGKGGLDVSLDDMRVVASTEDVADPNGQLIDHALMAFAVKFKTATKPIDLYAAVEFDGSKEKPDQYRVEGKLFTKEGRAELPFTREALEDTLKHGEIRQAQYKLDRKLVIFDISDDDPRFHHYKELPVTDVHTARSILRQAGYQTASKSLGAEHNIQGPVHEVIALPDAYTHIRKLLAGEWKEYSREPKNDEGKAWGDATENPSDFSGRSREKDPSPWNNEDGGPTHQKPKADEGKQMSDETEQSDKFPGRSREKNETELARPDFDRSVKNDEFDGNHMSDGRTESVSEWPGRAAEGPVADSASPEQMLRFEQKRNAQGLPPEVGGQPARPKSPLMKGEDPAEGILPGSMGGGPQEVPMPANPDPLGGDEAAEDIPLPEEGGPEEERFAIFKMAPDGTWSQYRAAIGQMAQYAQAWEQRTEAEADQPEDLEEAKEQAERGEAMIRYTEEDESPAEEALKVGRRIARYLDYLVEEKGLKVQAACFCNNSHGSCVYCSEFGCSGCSECNTSRGILAVQAQKNKPGTDCDMCSAKSQPSPGPFPSPDSMDGLDGLGDVEPQVVPSREGEKESQVRQGQKAEAVGGTQDNPQYWHYQNVGTGEKLPVEQRGAEGLPYDPMQQYRKQGPEPTLAGEPQVQAPMQALAINPDTKEAEIVDPNWARAQGWTMLPMSAEAAQRLAITTTGTDNDPPTVENTHESMDGMEVHDGDESPKVCPSETTEAQDCVAPGINKNPDQDITDDSELEPNDGMGPRPKYDPPTNSGATKKDTGPTHEWSPKKESALNMFQLSGGSDQPRPAKFHRTVAMKKKAAMLARAEKAYQAKRASLLEDWRAGIISDLDECNARVAMLDDEFTNIKKKLASDMGREKAGGGEMAQFEEGRDKYHQSEQFKNRSEFKDMDWWKRFDEKAPWKGGGSHNYHPTLRGDEGKERSDETEDSNKWAGRSREKNDDPTVEKMDEINPNAKELGQVKGDEGRERSDDSEKPGEWPGRTHEKRTKTPSKNVTKHMYREESLKTAKDPKCRCKEGKCECDPEGPDDGGGGDGKDGVAGYVNAQRRQADKVPGGGPETSYAAEGKADISTNMPAWEYDCCDDDKGRSDQAQDVPTPLHRSENVDEDFYSDGKYLKKNMAGVHTREKSAEGKVTDAVKKKLSAGS